MSPRHRRGAALIVVLWLVAGLSLLVLAGARSTREHTRLAALHIERLRAQAILDGAIGLLAQRLLRAPDAGQTYQTYRLDMDDMPVWLEVTPSKGLVDPNVASLDVLQALLENVAQLPSAQAMSMAARIRDWVDVDDQPGGVGGAEAPQYRAAGWPSLPRNSGMSEPSEVLAVLGVTPQLYEKIQPFLGVNGQQRIDIGAAPPALIDQLTGRPGLGQWLHSLSPESRDAEVAVYTATALFEFQPKTSDRTIRLRARVAIADDRWWEREVWIDRAERPDTLTPWTTMMVEPTRRSAEPGQDTNP